MSDNDVFWTKLLKRQNFLPAGEKLLSFRCSSHWKRSPSCQYSAFLLDAEKISMIINQLNSRRNIFQKLSLTFQTFSVEILKNVLSVEQHERKCPRWLEIQQIAGNSRDSIIFHLHRNKLPKKMYTYHV